MSGEAIGTRVQWSAVQGVVGSKSEGSTVLGVEGELFEFLNRRDTSDCPVHRQWGI